MNSSREWTCQRCQAEVAIVLHGEAERDLSCPACWANAPEIPAPTAPASAVELPACDACAAPILPGHTALDYCVNCGAPKGPMGRR